MEEAVRNRTEIAEVKRKYDTGEIDREEAKRQAAPILSYPALMHRQLKRPKS